MKEIRMQLNLHSVKKMIMLITCMVPFSAISCMASVDDLYKEGNALYLKQSYNQSIEKYEQVIKQSGASFEAYFNLGNSYYKTGNFTLAILNYERAKKIKPFDDDLAMNLALANQNTIDKIEGTPQVFYQQWWNNYLTGTTADVRSWLAIAAVWLAFLTACLYIFSKKYTFKKISFMGVFVFSVIAIFFLYVAQQQHELNTASQDALVISQSSFVKSSPDDKGTNLFQLHSGTKINITDELQGWKKIKIPNGNEGWIPSRDLEII